MIPVKPKLHSHIKFLSINIALPWFEQKVLSNGGLLNTKEDVLALLVYSTLAIQAIDFTDGSGSTNDLTILARVVSSAGLSVVLS